MASHMGQAAALSTEWLSFSSRRTRFLLQGKFPAHDGPWLLSPKGSPQWASPGSAKMHQDMVHPTLLDNLEAAV